jgi:hypothetical protein
MKPALLFALTLLQLPALGADPLPRPPGNGIENALGVYQALTGRTIVRTPVQVSFQDQLKLDTNRPLAELVRTVENWLKDRQITCQHFGEKFCAVVPTARAALLSRLPEPPKAGTDKALLAQGTIRMVAADLDQSLAIYRELTGRTILHSEPLSGFKIFLTSGSALSVNETIWAFEATYLLADLAVVKQGSNLVCIYPANWAGAGQLPQYNAKISEAPADVAAQALNIKPAPVWNRPLIPPPPGQPGPAKPAEPQIEPPVQLLEAYAKLTNRKAVHSLVNPEKYRFTLINPKPLTKAEAIFALETVAALHQLRFEVMDADRVTIQLQ